MKVSFHMGKGSAKHNDRSFNVEKADHIDLNRSPENKNFIFQNDYRNNNLTYKVYELQFYNERYGPALKATNDNYIKQRHPERCKTMDDWYKTFCPTEAIIQIGNKDDNIRKESLDKAFANTYRIIRKKYPQMRPLDMALHVDEASPHIHFRFTIEGHDRNGNVKPLKKQGLKEMGVELPDPKRPEGKKNNRLMTFTAEIREVLLDEVEKLGFDIDRVPRPESQHVSTTEYKQRKAAEALAKTTEDLNNALDNLENINNQIDEAKHEYNELKKKEDALIGRELDYKEIREIYKKSIWSQQDKDNIIKTAVASAQNAEEAKLNRKQNKSLEQQLSALKDTNEQLQNQRNNLEEQLLLIRPQELLENEITSKDQEIVALKEDIRVRDRFIIENGLQTKFVETLKRLGHKLTIAIGSLSNSLKIK